MRKAHITPSGFSNMMTSGRGKDEKFGKTAESYAEEIVQRLIGYVPDEITTSAIEWGINNEPLAVEQYERERMIDVTGRNQRITHPELDYVSGECDGLVGTDGIIEVKCPNASNHFKNIRSGAQINDYKWQIQGYLWLYDRKWCDFVSFHPLQPDPYKISINRVVRDQEMIDQLSERCFDFWNELVMPIYNEITNR